MLEFKALVEYYKADNSKGVFFLTVWAETSVQAREIAEQHYSKEQIKFVVKAESYANGLFEAHYKNIEDAPETLKAQINGTAPVETETLEFEDLCRCVDRYSSALEIMKNFGGVVDSTESDKVFCQVNLKTHPEGLEKISCMTRKLIQHHVTTRLGDYAFFYFSMI